MKFLSVGKDGGPESSVTGFWLVEIKSLFSVVLLRFDGKSREAFHEHAFNCVSWLLRGRLIEHIMPDDDLTDIEAGSPIVYTPSLFPIWTWRDTFHKVDSVGNSWVLSFRGPWSRTWREYDGNYQTLTGGRKIENL